MTEREPCPNPKPTASSHQSLLQVENLTLPSFQVVVMTANTGCNRCLDRVSQVISKMGGFRECVLDVGNKQVIVKGDFKSQSDVP